MENIMGLGVDIEEISRFKGKTFGNPTLNKIFTQKELEYCFKKDLPEESLTARFCAKEALIKALPIKLFYNQIEISIKKGKPCFILPEEESNKYKIKLSISHCKNYSVAMVIVYN